MFYLTIRFVLSVYLDKKKGTSMSWEFAVLDWMQANWRGPVLDGIVPVFSALWDWGVPWFLLTAVLIWYKPTRKMGWCVLCAIGVELLVVSLGIKPLVDRLRPCDINLAIEQLVPRPRSASFPSGHTAQAFAVSGALYFCRSKWFVPVAVLSVLLALSRLYLYVHFPTDVAAGILIGWLCGWVAVVLCRRGESLKNQKKTKN